MTSEPTQTIKLYGTDEQVESPRVLHAGNLSAEIEAGNLRYIRFGGKEVMRAISYIVRDPDWGTYGPVISGLEIVEEADRFEVRYLANIDDGPQKLAYRAEIIGKSDGSLSFQAWAKPDGDFRTNRTGFVVLHSIDGVAGEPVRIERTDGTIVDSKFPLEIDPVQPMMDLRALTHWTDEGLEVELRMEGDTFEMEDQRNWTDASYKTYVRPLAQPWPYALQGGSENEQKVSLIVSGEAPSKTADSAILVSLSKKTGQMPRIGQGLHPDNAEATLTNGSTLAALNLSYVICQYNPQRGDTIETLVKQTQAVEALGAQPWLEAVVASVDGFEQELASLADDLKKANINFNTILVSPAADLGGTLPGSIWPDAPPADALYAAARAAFPNAIIGGGMFSFFTELNRKRPPKDSVDLIGFTTSGVVHAGDDRSVIETLSALPAIALSVTKIANGTPFSVGPSAIGMRANPYGNAPKSNPDNIRQAMNWNDPRQRALLGAVWTLGYIAQFASAGASCVAVGEPVGAFGTIYTPENFPQPWFDEKGGIYPVFHVLKALAGSGGSAFHPLDVSDSSKVIGIAIKSDQNEQVLLANLTPYDVQLELEFPVNESAILDENSFVEASQNIDFLDNWQPFEGPNLNLSGFSVVRLRAS